MKTIVLLDDDPDEYFLLSTALNELGIKAHVAWFTGISSLCNYLDHSETPPDMLFLDINLPPENGIDCLKELKLAKRYEDLPVIMYTNSHYPLDIEKCFEIGATVFMKKSSSFSKLKDNLKKLLAWNLISAMNLPEAERTILN
jgi:DNA-binding response OmpR family regulator